MLIAPVYSVSGVPAPRCYSTRRLRLHRRPPKITLIAGGEPSRTGDLPSVWEPSLQRNLCRRPHDLMSRVEVHLREHLGLESGGVIGQIAHGLLTIPKELIDGASNGIALADVERWRGGFRREGTQCRRPQLVVGVHDDAPGVRCVGLFTSPTFVSPLIFLRDESGLTLHTLHQTLKTRMGMGKARCRVGHQSYTNPTPTLHHRSLKADCEVRTGMPAGL
jgi:hypothetical protein